MSIDDSTKEVQRVIEDYGRRVAPGLRKGPPFRPRVADWIKGLNFRSPMLLFTDPEASTGYDVLPTDCTCHKARAWHRNWRALSPVQFPHRCPQRVNTLSNSSSS